MNRRDFFKWLGAAGASLAAAGEFDLERLLWVPGHKTIFLPTVTIPEPALVDKVLAAHGVRVPRYTITTREVGTMLFDKDWQLLNGKELMAKPAGLTAGDIDYLQHGLNMAPQDRRRLYPGGPMFGKGGGFSDGYARATRTTDHRRDLPPDFRPSTASKAGPIIGTDG